MRATFDAATAQDALAVMKKHYGRSSAFPVASRIELDASGMSLALRRNDMETGVLAVFRAAVETTGVVTLETDDFARALPKTGMTTAILDGDRLTLETDGASSTVRVHTDGDDVVSPYAGPMDTRVVLSGREAGAIARVLDASARGNDARAVLETVAFTANGNGTGEAAATDTYRLHVARLSSVAGDARTTLIVPEMPLRIAVKTAGSSLSEAVRIDAHGEHVALRYTGTKGPKKAPRVVGYSVSTRANAGPFPNYAQLMPGEDDAPVRWTITDAAGTAAALSRMTNKRNEPVMLDASGVSVSASMTLDGATTETVLPIQADGAPFGIAFNPDYAADAIAAAGDGATVLLRDGLKAALFQGPDVTALLMPMRVR